MARKIALIGRFVGYEFGDDGTVWSRWRSGSKTWVGRTPKLLKQSLRNGYMRVSVRTSGSKHGKSHSVHRLILEAFVGPCPEGHLCRHLNGNRLDNRLCNLKWGTPKENEMDKVLHGTTTVGRSLPQCSNPGSKNGRSKLTEAKVTEMFTRYRRGEKPRRLKREFGISDAVFWSVVKSKSWKHVTLSLKEKFNAIS